MAYKDKNREEIEALAMMDAEGDFYLPDGEVLIDEDTKQALRAITED